MWSSDKEISLESSEIYTFNSLPYLLMVSIIIIVNRDCQAGRIGGLFIQLLGWKVRKKLNETRGTDWKPV